jgi:hypothetical protein
MISWHTLSTEGSMVKDTDGVAEERREGKEEEEEAKAN